MRRGFTLIELVVTIGIMALITGVTLANHSKFGGQVMLRNLAYELALAVREAQTYGVSVRKTNSASNFDAGYGIYFNLSTPKEYSIFIDSTPDGLLTNTLEEVTKYNIGRGYEVSSLCLVENSGSCTPVNRIDILFKRPEPDAIIRGNGAENKIYSRAEIVLKSPRNDTMKVVVEVSGQISVEK